MHFYGRNDGRFQMLYKRGRRDRHDIVAEILESARGGAIKTHIMYKARLSYAQLNDYLTSLVDKGFLENLMTVENRQTKHLFKTSEAGEEFIKNFRTLDLQNVSTSSARYFREKGLITNPDRATK